VIRSTAFDPSNSAVPAWLSGLSFDTEGADGGGGGGSSADADKGDGSDEPKGTGDGKSGDKGTDEPKVFDAAYVKKLRDEAAASRVKAKELEAKFAGAKTPEEHAAALEELRKHNSETETKADANLRRALAAEHKLPPAVAKMLAGSTDAELEEHAKELAELFVSDDSTGPKRKRSGTPKGGLEPEGDAAGDLPKDPAESAAKYGPRANSLF
jgi:hypothetical protein